MERRTPFDDDEARHDLSMPSPEESPNIRSRLLIQTDQPNLLPVEPQREKNDQEVTDSDLDHQGYMDESSSPLADYDGWVVLSKLSQMTVDADPPSSQNNQKDIDQYERLEESDPTDKADVGPVDSQSLTDLQPKDRAEDKEQESVVQYHKSIEDKACQPVEQIPEQNANIIAENKDESFMSSKSSGSRKGNLRDNVIDESQIDQSSPDHFLSGSILQGEGLLYLGIERQNGPADSESVPSNLHKEVLMVNEEARLIKGPQPAIETAEKISCEPINERVDTPESLSARKSEPLNDSKVGS